MVCLGEEVEAFEKEFSAEELARRLPVKTREKYDGFLSDDLLVASRAADQIDLEEASDALSELAGELRVESG